MLQFLTDILTLLYNFENYSRVEVLSPTGQWVQETYQREPLHQHCLHYWTCHFLKNPEIQAVGY